MSKGYAPAWLSCSLLISLMFLSCQPAGENVGVFKEEPCPFPLPDGVVEGENFRFGYIHVPEWHDQPNGKTLKLAVGIFPSTGDNPSADPIVMNTSGPGKSNLDNFIPQIAGGLGNYLLPSRDIVIIELRGLRYSTPFLTNDELRNAQKTMMSENLSTPEAVEKIKSALRKSKK